MAGEDITASQEGTHSSERTSRLRTTNHHHPSPTTPRRHRRSRVNDPNTGGWDIPPPVASPMEGKWCPRNCRLQTSQRIATLQHDDAATCHPIIYQQKYVIVATNCNEIVVFGNFPSMPWEISTPLCKLYLGIDATIVSLTVGPNDHNYNYNPKNDDNYDDNTKSIFVLSVEGHVFEITIDESIGSSKSEQPPELMIVSSWCTETCGATSFAFVDDQIIIGYNSGLLESWQKSARESSKPRLCWRGNAPHAIRSLMPLKKSSLQRKTSGGLRASPKNNTSLQGDDAFFLVLTLQPEAGAERVTTKSLLEILDLSRLKSTYINNKRQTVSLLEHFKLPVPGMELYESSSLPSDDTGRFPKRLQSIPSRGSNCSTSSIDFAQCAVALSDGTIVVLSSKGSDSWGVGHDLHQLLISYPAVGCGRIGQGDETSFVFCMRGGTSFLISNNTNQEEIKVIGYPHDIDSDNSSVYLQGFTCGTISTDSHLSKLPVLIYSWAGGVTDIYACNLVRPPCKFDKLKDQVAESSPEERQVLQDMLDNESILLVGKLLDAIQKNPYHPLRDDPIWEAISQETKTLDMETLTIQQLCSQEFDTLRMMLLAIASS